MTAGTMGMVWMLIKGAQATSDTWSFLDRWGKPMQPTPAYLGEGWWLVGALNQLPLNDEVLQAVSRAERALILTEDDAVSWSVLLVEARSRTVVRIDPNGPIDPAITIFSRHRPPPRGDRPRRTQASEFPLPLKDAGARWLKRCGWPIHAGIDPILFLRGARGSTAVGLAFLPSRVGELRICGELTRWAIDVEIAGDNGEEGLALWDRDNPDAPVMRWPIPDEDRPHGFGTAALARAEFQRRVIDPILDATRLDGERFWAAAPALRNDDQDCGAVIAHWHPRGTISVIEPWQPPLTRLSSQAGSIPLTSWQAKEFDPEASGMLDVDEPLADAQTGLRVASISIRHVSIGDWLPIPDQVPRGLLETCAWVRSQVAADPAYPTLTQPA